MATTSISITPQFGNNTVTQINCGTSSPKLSGIISLSAYPNLQEFRCINHDITAISGYENNANLTFINLVNNKITGNLPSFTGTPNLRTAVYNNNLYSGTIPNYNAELRNFQCVQNLLSGPIPDLTNNNGWINFLVHLNNFTGPIPPSLSNQFAMLVFSCYANPLTGSIPNIDSCTRLQRFLLASCNLTGSIPNLTNNVDLTESWFHNNFLTGSIPSLSANTKLERFLCQNQRGTSKLTGFAGGSASNTLGDFQAQNNQLTQTTVNTILSTFDATTRVSGTRLLNLGGTGNSAPSYTGGITTTSPGSNFSRTGTLVTANVTGHGHTTGDLVTITGITETAFQGTFSVTVINPDQFQYTTETSGSVIGSGTATMRRTTNANDGFRSYQNLALVTRLGEFPWNVTIRFP